MSKIGRNRLGAAFITTAGTAFPVCVKYVADQSFTASVMDIFCNVASGTCGLTMGIYADNGGVPGVKLSDTDEVTITTSAHWYRATLDTPVSITNGTTYWLCQAHGSVDLRWWGVAGGDARYIGEAYTPGQTPASNPSSNDWDNTNFAINASDGLEAMVPLIVTEGNSWVYGYNASSGQGTVGGTTWQATMLSLLGDVDAINIGVNGSTWADLETRQAAADAYYDATRPVNVLIVFEDINSLGISGRTPAQCHDDAEAYMTDAQTAGWVVVTNTCPPNQQGGTGFNALRDTLNPLRLADYTGYSDAIVRIDQNATIGDNGDETDVTYYDADKIHLTDAGYVVLGTLYAAAVEPLLAGGVAPLPLVGGGLINGGLISGGLVA